MTVVFYECFEEEQKAIEAICPGGIKACFFKETIQECGRLKPLANVVSIRTQSIIPKAWGSKIKAVVSRSTGQDHLLGFVQETQTPCAYLPEYCKEAVAQQAIIMSLALLRKLPLQTQAIKKFCRDGLTGRQWTEKNLLVVGVGKIGKEVVKIGKALGMIVYGVDVDEREGDVNYVSFDPGIEGADAIVCAADLNETTRNMFCLARFKQMKNKSVFVNVARGEIAPFEEIKKALEQGLLYGAGIDVYDEESALAEKLRAGDKEKKSLIENLQKEHNLLLTPHNAFNTQEAVQKKAKQTWDVIRSWIETGRIPDENRVKIS